MCEWECSNLQVGAGTPHSNMFDRNVLLIFLSFFLLVCYCVLLYFIVMHPQIISVNLYLLRIQYHAIFAWYPQDWVLHLLVFQDSNFQCAKRHNWKRLVMSQRAVAPLPAKFRLSKPFLCPPLNRWMCHQSISVSKEATTDNSCWRLWRLCLWCLTAEAKKYIYSIASLKDDKTTPCMLAN